MTHKRLHKKLVRMMEKDQKATGLGSRAVKNLYKDQAEELKKIIKDHDWPSITMVGEKGVEAAWIIAQHADHDVDFQKQVLKLIKSAFKAEEALKHHLAYLTDRILVNEGKPQRYGTQLKITRGNIALAPVEDEKVLDQLRSEYNLPPKDLYLDMVKNKARK